MIERGHTEIGGRPVDLARLEAGAMEVAVLSYGAITRDWRVAGRSIVLGYDDPAAYGADPSYIGAIAGRVANRIAGGRFEIHGEEVALPLNDGPNHLHGGPRGLSKRHWGIEADTAGNAVRLSYVSGHGDGGYPGRAAFEVVIAVTENSVSYEMRAEVDRPTPINLAQHNYYNLTGGEIWDHELQIAAEDYLPIDPGGIPLGDRAPVAGTSKDFRKQQRIGDVDRAREGIDHCLLLSGDQPAAILTAPGAPKLRFHTDQPGLQLYTGQHLQGPHRPFTGVCLEPEVFPDAVNQQAFPSVLVYPEAPYFQRLMIEVA